MAKSRTDAEARGCVKVGGREYVNVSVFAQRMGVSQQAISKQIAAGKLTRKTLEGYKGQWLDFELCRIKFNKMRKKPIKGGSRKKREAQVIEIPTGKEVRPVSIPTTGGAEDVGMPELPKDAAEILAYFNPEAEENADCWEVDDEGRYIMLPSPHSDRHSVDWEKAIKKSMANIRYQQYQKERRELIPRQEVEQALSLIFPPVTATIMQMPDKFATRINGRVDDMLQGRANDFFLSLTPSEQSTLEKLGLKKRILDELSKPSGNDDKTIIKSLLADEAERICHNLQDAVEKALEKDE